MYRYPICKILNLLFLIALAAPPCNRAGAQEGQVEKKEGFAVAVRLVPQTADLDRFHGFVDNPIPHLSSRDRSR